MFTIQQRFQVNYSYPVHFCRDLFNPSNPLLAQSLPSSTAEPTKVIIFVDEGLASAQPGLLPAVETYLSTRRDTLQLMAPPQLTPGGERAKGDEQVFGKLIQTLKELNPCRHSYVIAIGGGSMLDSVGLAASLIHRGVRLIRIPSTVLAQNDAGVGVKNGIDDGIHKNFLGSFAPPAAVINDFDLLTTLPQSYWLAGIAEAFKVAIIKDATFFKLLEISAPLLKSRDEKSIEKLIQHCAQIHLDHIASSGDPFEMGSARPLDFGHWAAHKLETLSDYSINHGQAVAIGIALDSHYACLQSLITQEECERIIAAMQACGLTLQSEFLHQRTAEGQLEILAGLEAFRIHLGGELTITLPTAIGSSREIHEMDFEIIEQAIARLK